MKKILLQTTIPFSADDWTINRFSFLSEYLSSLTDESGRRLYQVVARDRVNSKTGDDTVLSRLDNSDYAQLWLFGVDVGAAFRKTTARRFIAFDSEVEGC